MACQVEEPVGRRLVVAAAAATSFGSADLDARRRSCST